MSVSIVTCKGGRLVAAWLHRVSARGDALRRRHYQEPQALPRAGEQALPSGNNAGVMTMPLRLDYKPPNPRLESKIYVTNHQTSRNACRMHRIGFAALVRARACIAAIDASTPLCRTMANRWRTFPLRSARKRPPISRRSKSSTSALLGRAVSPARPIGCAKGSSRTTACPLSRGSALCWSAPTG